ncbi:MAG TPA: FAD-dependent oxidoreductase [Ktedonobacterales bacterium]|nr:FAD-dependent oxidoreductase [Ktedonobacterales bacterium]
MDTQAVDVVVIGGGVQGLVILDTLIAAGYSCALVTEGDLGAGQTIHSHGFLNTGFGMAGRELPETATQIVHPYLRARGVTLTGNWAMLPPSGLRGLLLRARPAFARLPAAHLPGGFSPTFKDAARVLPDYSFNKRQLVTALSQGREEYIVRGSVTGFRGRAPVEAVVLRPEGSDTEVELRAGAVVIAAGCGSKRLLRILDGAAPQLKRIKHRVVHMLCLRAPHNALPATSIAALSLGLLLAAHDDGKHVLWYVTPMRLGGPSFDEVPNDAEAPVDPTVLRRAWDTLQTLYPPLLGVEGLQVGHYAGYRQDIGIWPGRRLCAVVAGGGNVVAALPSGLVGPWRNAADTLTLVRGLTAPSRAQPALPGAGRGVRVGSPVEDRPGFTWQSWEEWSRALPQLSA